MRALGKWKGLPRISLCHDTNSKNEGMEGAVSNRPLLQQFGKDEGRKGAASSYILLQ
jgi:hypothetical protein